MHRSVICGFVRRKNAVQCCSDRDIWIFLGMDVFIPRIAVVTDRSLVGAACCISICRRDHPCPKQLAMTNALGMVARGSISLLFGLIRQTPLPQEMVRTSKQPAQVALGIASGSAGAMITLRAACPWRGV